MRFALAPRRAAAPRDTTNSEGIRMTPTDYALTDAQIVDVAAGEIRTGLAVVVKGGKIAAIVPEGDLDTRVAKVSLEGRYLSPGLLDCHAHCFIGGFDDGTNVLPSELTARAGKHLKGMLMRGFTTVRDAGGADQGHRVIQKFRQTRAADNKNHRKQNCIHNRHARNTT